jgi:hypothetical protein
MTAVCVMCVPWRNLENSTLSSLHKLLQNRLVWGGNPRPLPPYTHKLTGRIRFLTIDAKTTVHNTCN